MTTFMRNGFLLAAAFCAMLISSSASAACPDTESGTYVASGSGAAFPGQNTYYLNGVRVGPSCVRKRVCELGANGKPFCWFENQDVVPTMAVGEFSPSFDGPGTTSYWPAVTSNQGGDGWRYTDTTVNGNFTRTWFRYNNGAPQVVFEV